MRRFTVSLPEDLYSSLVSRGEESTPPASLQQMVRYAVDTMLQEPRTREAEPGGLETEQTRSGVEPTDLLVFSVHDVSYGLPIGLVETVAAGLKIHSVPSSSNSLLGVAGFRDTLTEVHDGGTLLQHSPLDATPSLLAIPGTTSRVLLAVSSVLGLTPQHDLKWATPPISSPPWVAALAWAEDAVITVVNPATLNL